jgi:integrase
MFNINVIQDALGKEVKMGNLSVKTNRDYVNCLMHLNEKLDNKASPAELESAIYDLCKESAQGHKYIAAVRRYEKEVLGAEALLLFGEPLFRLYQRYGNPKLGKELSHSEDTYFRKVNRLGNERLKLAFRLQYRSGLRISEIAALEKEDILFGDNSQIKLNVRCGKGRKSRVVDVVDDSYLYKRLKAHIEVLGGHEPLFYSENYLKKKAVEHDIKTHDLRRINSRDRFRKETLTGSGKRQARRAVSQQLGHENPATTNIYLGEEWSDQNERG